MLENSEFKSDVTSRSRVSSANLCLSVHILGDHEVGVAPTNVRWVGQVQGVRAKSPNEVYMWVTHSLSSFGVVYGADHLPRKVKWCYNTIAQLKESGIPLP